MTVNKLFAAKMVMRTQAAHQETTLVRVTHVFGRLSGIIGYHVDEAASWNTAWQELPVGGR